MVALTYDFSFKTTIEKLKCDIAPLRTIDKTTQRPDLLCGVRVDGACSCVSVRVGVL